MTKAPAWGQGAVFGLCVGLFVAAGAEADTRNPVISSVILLVLTVSVTAWRCGDQHMSP
jgi:F0F1-type ATP synthase membrane subunit c/vacuolar-type H+-ATPase subunit K